MLTKCHQKRGSIILLGSIYSKLGQNLDNYKGTNMSENYSYSIIKGGLDNATRQISIILWKILMLG